MPKPKDAKNLLEMLYGAPKPAVVLGKKPIRGKAEDFEYKDGGSVSALTHAKQAVGGVKNYAPGGKVSQTKTAATPYQIYDKASNTYAYTDLPGYEQWQRGIPLTGPNTVPNTPVYYGAPSKSAGVNDVVGGLDVMPTTQADESSDLQELQPESFNRETFYQAYDNQRYAPEGLIANEVVNRAAFEMPESFDPRNLALRKDYDAMMSDATNRFLSDVMSVDQITGDIDPIQSLKNISAYDPSIAGATLGIRNLQQNIQDISPTSYEANFGFGTPQTERVTPEDIRSIQTFRPEYQNMFGAVADALENKPISTSNFSDNVVQNESNYVEAPAVNAPMASTSMPSSSIFSMEDYKDAYPDLYELEMYDRANDGGGAKKGGAIGALHIKNKNAYKDGGAVKRVHISDNPDTMLLELTRAPRMQDGGSVDQFLGRTAPRGVSALPGYGQGKEDVQQALTALEESPAGRIASGVGELAEGYMSGAGSTDLQKIGQGLSMIPVLGLPATVAKTARTAKAVKPTAEAVTNIKTGFKAPQDKALLEAQRNAALPVEQGGLGLPPDNTADMRAAAMGYQDYYHGTERLDRLLEKEVLDPRRATSGPMPYGAAEREMASRYATSKRDTSRLAGDEGDVANYFTVNAKDLGSRSKADVPVEKAFYFLPREKQQEIISKMSRIGYENPREASGDIVLHPEGTVGTIVDPKTIDYYMKREAKGNPLTALRMIWHDSGTLFGNEEQLAKVFELSGFPLSISQKNAPWSSAQGVLTGKAKLEKPLMTTDSAVIEQQVIPALKQAFAKDRTQKKPYGPDQWSKDVRFTPKEWVAELEKDMAEGKNSFVWTSIPDKVTAELRKLGFDGVVDVGGKGGGSEYRVVIPFDTKQVRSRFAAFDPKKKDQPGLLKAKGGKVTISDNLDTMRLELLRKKHA